MSTDPTNLTNLTNPTNLATGRVRPLDPRTCVVITMEMQRGVCGDLATMPVLAGAVDEAGVVPATASVLTAGRERGVPVIHCTFSLLADREGTPLNAPLIRMLVKDPVHLLHGSAAAELIPALGIDPSDLISNRHHGFSPFTGTDLDALIRELRSTTVVVTGMSLNLGIPGTVIEAVNLGYEVVVVRDCVAGMPVAYGDEIIANTLSMVAAIVTADELILAWDQSS